MSRWERLWPARGEKPSPTHEDGAVTADTFDLTAFFDADDAADNELNPLVQKLRQAATQTQDTFRKQVTAKSFELGQGLARTFLGGFSAVVGQCGPICLHSVAAMGKGLSMPLIPGAGPLQLKPTANETQPELTNSGLKQSTLSKKTALLQSPDGNQDGFFGAIGGAIANLFGFGLLGFET